jgi:phosphoglycolate phosphatase-like HAD superfamily hydrolase
MSRATVIFDFDGTLANSVELMIRLYNEHALEFGYQTVNISEFPLLRRMSYRQALKSKGIKYRMLPRMARLLSSEMRSHMAEVLPYEGIIDAVRSLKEEGFSVGVLTSNRAPLVKEFFAIHGFPDFDFVVSEKTLFGKDKALRKILARYGLSNNQVLYVGDEPRDVVASHRAGIQVVAVSWGLGGKEAFEKTIPDVLVDTPSELLSVIEDLAD